MSWTDVFSIFSGQVTGPDNSSGNSSLASAPTYGSSVDLTEIKDGYVLAVTVSSDVTGSGGEVYGVSLQGSLDGTNWYTLSGNGEGSFPAGTTLQVSVNGSARFIRASVSVLTFAFSSGVTATVSIVAATQN